MTTKTARQLIATAIKGRATAQLIDDYKLGSRQANSAGAVDEFAAWMATLGAIETELNGRGIRTCDECGWPNGDHDLDMCSAA